MSHPKPPAPAKLVIGIITRETAIEKPVVGRLEDAFGAVDMISPWLPFEDTAYYAPEMGENLKRRLLAFRETVDPGLLGSIKIKTNAIENAFLRQGKRSVNIDPGLLTPERLVLATGKNYAHRIYIGSHIYADLTLIYQQGRFQPLPWTYPDYRRANVQDFLIRVRNKYLIDLKPAEF